MPAVVLRYHCLAILVVAAGDILSAHYSREALIDTLGRFHKETAYFMNVTRRLLLCGPLRGPVLLSSSYPHATQVYDLRLDYAL